MVKVGAPDPGGGGGGWGGGSFFKGEGLIQAGIFHSEVVGVIEFAALLQDSIYMIMSSFTKRKNRTSGRPAGEAKVCICLEREF